MNQFFAFIKAHPLLKLSLIFGFIFLSLLPGRNSYYDLQLNGFDPVVRSTSYQPPLPSLYPVNQHQVSVPPLTSQAAIVVDAASKTILYSRNADQKLFPASLTKIMTALVSLDNYSLDEVVTIGKIETDPYLMDLVAGEKITVENLLYGLLTASANDAALALAANYPQGEDAFIQAMNQKAKDLKLTKTQFANVVGFDDFDNYSTVHDLSLLTAAAMTNPVIKTIVATKTITVTDISGQYVHELENLNELLGEVPGLTGVKTGRTSLAGECLITFTERDNHALITVVLGSQDRFTDSQQLIDWAFTNFRWQPVAPAIGS